jgi:3-oxoacyl-(acyl-carrier-protein) synthase
MDPQHRLLLETSYEAFEDAGVPMDVLAGSKTAVYVGIGPGDYGRMCAQRGEEIGAHYVTGNFLSTAVDRIAYFFDLRGPSMAVDTACSSSLVSLHLACRSLEDGDADLALAGGVNALLSPTLSISLAKAGALSPTGRCRSFDADADGYVRGEGAGFVVLKRLDDALADGDRVYAIVRGTSVKQGGRRNGLTAPGGWGEEAVMKAAWLASGIEPTQVDYVETQGTGTLLGDAIEGTALGKVFGPRNGSGLCRIGSVKTNIGHLETAAGVAGLIKVGLMISHGEFVPSLYPKKPNPHVNLEKLGLTVQMHTESWPVTAASPRAAGISSFGLGGTYAHVCLTGPEAALEISQAADSISQEFLIPLSARHEDALRELVGETAGWFTTATPAAAMDLCRAAAVRRTHHDYRVAFAGLSAAEVALAMDCWLRKPKSQFAKANAQRKLVVLTSETQEFADTFAALDRWEVRPVRILRLVQGRIIAGPDFPVGSTPVEPASEIGLAELQASGTDFLDLTGENFLGRLDPPLRGTVLSGLLPGELSSVAPLRLAAELYRLGYPLAWRKIYPGRVKQVNWPRYPWQHQVCWRESLVSESPAAPKPVVPGNQAVTPPSGSVQALLARLTGLPLQQIQLDASPAELGIDSLMTLELQEELRRMSGTLLPVEILVSVKSVRELELLLQGETENSASQPGTNMSTPRPSRDPQSSTEVREASLGEYEQIAALTFRNGLDTKTREQWEHLWINNPVYKRVQNWPIGWVVRDGEQIVGFLGNIPVSYRFKGRDILASSLHAFSLAVSHRGHGLILLNRLLESAPGVEYFVGSTANASSSSVLDRLGVARIPVGDWENSAFWITNHDGFASSAVLRKGWPGSLTSLTSLALRTYDKLLKASWPRQNHQLYPQKNFDERFDVFWEELQLAYPDRFLATRSREVLDWHFKFALADNRAWIVTHEIDSRILAYAIFQRHDYREINLKRVRLVDYQALPESSDLLVSMLAWGLSECRAQDIHMLEAGGFRPDKQRVIDRLAPHRRKLAAWTYFHKTSSPELQHELQDPHIWDPSQFDGDASL